MEFDGDELVTELRKSREVLDRHGTKLDRRVSELGETVDDLCRRMNRPGGDGGYSAEEVDERKDLVAWLHTKHALATPKNDGGAPAYEPTSAEISDAAVARKAMRPSGGTARPRAWTRWSARA